MMVLQDKFVHNQLDFTASYPLSTKIVFYKQRFDFV